MANTIREVPGHKGYYATIDGRIWSAPKIGSSTMGIYLKPRAKSCGHLQMCLMPDKRNYYVHRLILETFVGKCPDGMEACHINGSPACNHIYNLRWDTKSNNQKDSIKYGTYPDKSGENNPYSKLKEQDVRITVYMYKIGKFTQKKLAEIYGVKRQTISDIINKRNWKYIWRN